MGAPRPETRLAERGAVCPECAGDALCERQNATGPGLLAAGHDAGLRRGSLAGSSVEDGKRLKRQRAHGLIAIGAGMLSGTIQAKNVAATISNQRSKTEQWIKEGKQAVKR
jgi:hypothetical protein